MKLFAIFKNITPRMFFKKNFKIFSPLFLAVLLLTQSFISYAFYGKNPHFDDFYRSERIPLLRPHGLNYQNFDWIHSIFQTKFDYERKVSNQITITSVLKTSYCTGESGSIAFETSGVFNTINRFSVQLSNFNGNFSNPTIIGFINSSTTGSNVIPFKIPLSIIVGNGYRVRVVASSPIINSAINGANIQITTLPVPSIAVSSQIICPGGSASLLATCGSGTVKWYNQQENGNSITTLTVSPTVSTDYFAACEDGVSCSSARNRQMIIVNIPNVLIPPSFSSCLNSDIELAVVTDETNLVYAWTGPSGFSSTLQNPTITNLTQTREGVYSVRITNANSCLVTGTTSVSIGTALQNLNVFGDVNVCFGDSIKLRAASSVPPGMAYSWTGPGSFTASGREIARPASAFNGDGSISYNRGLYTVIATNSTSGCTGTNSIDVAVANRPNVPLVLPVGSVCYGTDYALNLAISGANFQRYAWTGPNGFTASAIAVCNSGNSCNDLTVNIANFLPLNAGLYSLKATFIDENNRSCELKAIKSITIKSNPDIAISSNSTVCLGDVLLFNTTFDPTVTGIGSYAWVGPNSFTSSAQNPIIYTNTVTGSGIYKLTATGINLCIATATTLANIVESVPPIVEPTASVVLSNSITLVASGCDGILNWYQSSNNQPVTMPVSPVVSFLYYVKCNVSGCFSGKSGDIAVSIKPPVAISIKTGDWEDRNTWDISRVPLPIDSVIIRPNHYVTISTQVNAKWLAWSGYGNLKFALSRSALHLFGAPPSLTPPPPPPGVVNPPVLESNPVSVVENTSVTFTASGSREISWYKNGINLNINELTYTVNLPVRGDTYTTKSTVSGITSVESNAITVIAATPPPSSSGVTITTPNKPPYYFSNGHPPSHYDGNVNLPVIFTNQPRYDAVNDFVWLKNDKIKIGINLKRGGQLAWASLADATTNLVYNGYDGGFQITLDTYQKKDGYTQGGEVAGSAIRGMPTSYNVIQGGDFLNNAVSLIDYHEVQDGYYVKIRPIHYPLSAKLSETFLEATYTIVGRSVKIDYRYTSFRTDGQWNGAGFDGAGAPSCFIVNTLNKYKTYAGSSPWSFLPTSGGILPITNMGQNNAEAHTTEHWGMVYDAQRPNSGIGVYNPTNRTGTTYFIFKQMEIFPGNGPGTEFTSGFTFFQPFIDFNVTNRNNFVKDVTAYVIIGSELEIRSEVYKFAGHAGNIPRF